MRPHHLPWLLGTLLGSLVPWAVGAGRAPAAEERKVVIPFDFVSRFDEGRYGRTVGELIWKRLEREGGFILPETMLDVRDTCTQNDRHPSPELSDDEVKKIVQGDFGAQIGIWGSVERVPGNDWDVYDLVIRCIDFAATPEAKVVYQCRARTETVSEIPHRYVAELLDALNGRRRREPPTADSLAEENWKKNPSLVTGDFQRGARGAPAGWLSGWEAGEVDQWEPLGKTVQWTAEDAESTNRLIRFTLSRALGDTTGVAYYSDFFPVEEAAKYRFQCRWKSDGPEVKVFVKCYDLLQTEYGEAGAGAGKEAEAAAGYVPELAEMREVYRSQQNLSGPADTWNTHTEDFTPKHTRYEPRWGRVMLYAYLGAGEVEFDDVVLKRIMPASPGELGGAARHSLGSDVSVDEMEENRRRSQKVQEAPRRDDAEPP